MQSPSYIKTLLSPNGKKPAGRKVWSIDLETVWLPFFTATNCEGDTRIAPDALGAPLRLAYDADGSIRFSKAGRPITKVARELADNIRMVRDNFSVSLMSYTKGVISEKAKAYKAQLTLSQKAGAPIMAHDKAKLDEALALAIEEAVKSAEAEVEVVAETIPEAKEAVTANA